MQKAELGILKTPKPKLLLIVDDWELLERYEERFSKGFETYCAPLGAEGVRMARETQPDAVLLNLAFENMTQLEACTALRNDPLTCKIIIIAVGAGASGPDFWVDGPVTLEQLQGFIAKKQ